MAWGGAKEEGQQLINFSLSRLGVSHSLLTLQPQNLKYNAVNYVRQGLYYQYLRTHSPRWVGVAQLIGFASEQFRIETGNISSRQSKSSNFI